MFSGQMRSSFLEAFCGLFFANISAGLFALLFNIIGDLNKAPNACELDYTKNSNYVLFFS